MCRTTHFDEPSCLGCPTSCTGPVLRPDFMHRACAEARSAAKCGRDSSTESRTSPVRLAPMPLGPAHHTLVSLPQPRFAMLGPDMTPAPAKPQPDVVVTQQYLSSPGSRSSTPLYDLAEFGSANSSVAMSESFNVASVVPSDVLPVVAQFMPLDPQ